MDNEKMDLDSTSRIPTGPDLTMDNAEHASLGKGVVPEIPTPVAGVPDIQMETEASDALDTPPLTSGLEALLGGLNQPINSTENIPTLAPLEDLPLVEKNSIDALTAPLPLSSERTAIESAVPTHAPKVITESVLEQPEPTNASPIETEQPAASSTAIEGTPADEEHPEWEIDSSPIESSSDDSSSDDSSSDDESDEGDSGYKLLSPEEQARILMEGDGGSDDEGGTKGAKGSGSQLRTKNEIPEVVIPKPDVTITPAMPIEVLGSVETMVENTVLIKAQTSGEYRVLESGSVLCLEDRSVIGVVSETIGRVEQPFYSILFTNDGEIAEAGLSLGTEVFYSAQHSTYVFTQALKAFKGSDASNLHDEEIGEEEMEFSDDEAEMEHKRRVKQQRADRRGGKMQQNGGSGRGGIPLQQQQTVYDPSKSISYDDADDDGPYKPLARPAGYADSVGRIEAPQEGSYQGGVNGHSNNYNRDQFRGRGRGDRGRGRGDRGRGRGGHQDRRGNGYSQPPQNRSNQAYPPQSPSSNFSQQQFQLPTNGFSQNPQTSQNSPVTSTGYASTEYSPLQPQLPPWPQFSPGFQPPPFPLPFQNMQNGWPMPNIPNMPSPTSGGAFINPAFFNNPQNPSPNHWNNQGQRGGRGRGGS
ncbi:hypothetical protein G7Y89_g379 [Cudoniella acicularis]|uniref:H/ACA ribonucleoprotein complex non-core subunit NAF1 n=1 Tax=Cudoniella acicularis TaxID=354080 RepID=A0A8H4RYZ2_9HELO|nr:hypothetical protein G7Y89_g379 [Cudoniella acicularis]